MDDGAVLSRLDRGLALDHGREALAVSPLEAVPELIVKMPGDSWAPALLTLALSVLFVAVLEASWPWAGAGAMAVVAALLLWTWPTRRLALIAGSARD
jgi:cytochrome c oxidase subunit 1/cytochrome c oxidase subunit I+III